MRAPAPPQTHRGRAILQLVTTSGARQEGNAVSRAELLTLRLRNTTYLSRESALLLSLLAEDERLLDVEPAGIGYAKPGLLAVTDRRVIHVYIRRVFPGYKLTEISYEDLRSVEANSWKSYARLRLRFRRLRRTVDFPIMKGGGRRAFDLETLVRSRMPDTP